MKLELKHIVGYLPYGLKIRSFREGQILFIEDIIASGEFLDYLFEKTHSRLNSTMIYKPILHPLSDLTKEIEVNGEKFVPTYELYKLIDEFGIGSPTIVISKTFSGISIHWYSGKQQSSTNPVPLSFYEKLYEWHFDVHGLLQKGLAIDKNTIL